MAAPTVPSTPSVSIVRALRARGRPEGGRSSSYVAFVMMLPVLSLRAKILELRLLPRSQPRRSSLLQQQQEVRQRLNFRWRVALKLLLHSCVQVVLWLRVIEHLWRDAKASFWHRVAE